MSDFPPAGGAGIAGDGGLGSPPRWVGCFLSLDVPVSVRPAQPLDGDTQPKQTASGPAEQHNLDLLACERSAPKGRPSRERHKLPGVCPRTAWTSARQRHKHDPLGSTGVREGGTIQGKTCWGGGVGPKKRGALQRSGSLELQTGRAVLEILAAGEPEVDVWWQRSGGVWWGGGLRIWGVGEGSGASQRLKVSCRLGRPLEAWGAGMHFREWLAAGLFWGQHLCAGLSSRGAWGFGGCRVPGILGAGLMSWGPGGAPGNFVC